MPGLVTPLNAVREKGYNDGFAGRERLSSFATPAMEAAYRRGYGIGQRERARHDVKVEAARAV